MPEDSGNLLRGNGTNLWLSRGKPIGVVLLAVAPLFISVGVATQKIHYLETELREAKDRIKILETNSVDKVFIQDTVNDAQAYARSAHSKIIQIEAWLTANGFLNN